MSEKELEESIAYLVFLITIFVITYLTLAIMDFAGLRTVENWFIFSIIYAFIWFVLYVISKGIHD